MIMGEDDVVHLPCTDHCQRPISLTELAADQPLQLPQLYIMPARCLFRLHKILTCRPWYYLFVAESTRMNNNLSNRETKPRWVALQ